MSVPSPGSADAAGSNVLRNLILEPFRSARQRGKVDWHQMHLGVLKNKILDSTHREFDEKRWGFETFGELVATLSDDIHLLFPDKRPPIAELTDSARKEIEQAGPVPAEQRLPERLRVDLWNAVMDYSSGREYVWDPNAEMARVAD